MKPTTVLTSKRLGAPGDARRRGLPASAGRPVCRRYPDAYGSSMTSRQPPAATSNQQRVGVSTRWPPPARGSEQRSSSVRDKCHVNAQVGIRPAARDHPLHHRHRCGLELQQMAAQRVFNHASTVTPASSRFDANRAGRRRGPPTQHHTETPTALLLTARHGGRSRSVSFWPFDCDRRSASFKATACAALRAFGSRTFPRAARKARWENSAPGPCTPAALMPVLIFMP